jgi:uncharacterized tellurite resistance protein B-like protein
MTGPQAEVSLWMVLIGADGDITEAELDAMNNAARSRFGDALPLGAVSTLAARAQQRIDLVGPHAFVGELLPHLSRDTARETISACIDIARADRLAPIERELLEFVAIQLGISSAEFTELARK